MFELSIYALSQAVQGSDSCSLFLIYMQSFIWRQKHARACTGHTLWKPLITSQCHRTPSDTMDTQYGVEFSLSALCMLVISHWCSFNHRHSGRSRSSRRNFFCYMNGRSYSPRCWRRLHASAPSQWLYSPLLRLYTVCHANIWLPSTLLAAVPGHGLLTCNWVDYLLSRAFLTVY